MILIIIYWLHLLKSNFSHQASQLAICRRVLLSSPRAPRTRVGWRCRARRKARVRSVLWRTPTGRLRAAVAAHAQPTRWLSARALQEGEQSAHAEPEDARSRTRRTPGARTRGRAETCPPGTQTTTFQSCRSPLGLGGTCPWLLWTVRACKWATLVCVW